MRRLKRDRTEDVYVITTVAPDTLPSRRRRYLTLMLLRVLSVPGVLLLPVPVAVQALVVVVAAVLQMGAVISANEPAGIRRPTAAPVEGEHRILPDGNVP